MKNFKRTFACFIIGAMLAAPSPLTSFGAGGSPPEIISVVLPTDAAWRFTLDPQGMAAGLANGQTGTLGELEGAAGTIICNAAPKITNNSSVPVTVDVALSLTGGNYNAVPMGANEAAVIAAVNANTNHNVFMYMRPSGDPNGYVLSKTEQTLKYVFGAGNYVLSGGNWVQAGSGKSITFSLGGYVTKNADWSVYIGANPAEKVGVKAVFTFAASTETEKSTLAALHAGQRSGLISNGGMGAIQVGEPLGTLAANATIGGTNGRTVEIGMSGYLLSEASDFTALVKGANGNTQQLATAKTADKITVTLPMAYGINAVTAAAWVELIVENDDVTVTVTRANTAGNVTSDSVTVNWK